MGLLDLPPTTESEEMYLLHCAMAQEDGVQGAVPLPLLAERLAVTAVSANEMVKKLEARGLLRYTPYQGVELTSLGAEVAARLLRVRRLWAVFLSDRLGLSADEADRVACELEHVTSSEVASRLARFLGDPTTGPSGRPIPAGDSTAPAQPVVSLAELGVDRAAVVVAVTGSAPEVAFLESAGVAAGHRLEIGAVSDRGHLLVDAAGGRVHLDPELASRVRVRPVPGA